MKICFVRLVFKADFLYLISKIYNSKGKFMQFNELHLSPEVLQAIEDMGFTELTEIQEKTIPLLMEGIDVIGRSNTGTGKTAAFGIPAVESISREADRKCVEVLILCPTRELAMQACEEIKKFSAHMKWVKPCAVYGGASIDRQILELKRGANIVVGTPGRIMDHIDRRTLKLQNVRTVILDEADEMLNMGFREDIESILKSVPDERQTVLFSATMPPEILAITKQYQTDPQIIKIVNKYRTVDTIEQYYFEVPAGRKNDALRFLLLAYEPKAAMIFCTGVLLLIRGLHGALAYAVCTVLLRLFPLTAAAASAGSLAVIPSVRPSLPALLVLCSLALPRLVRSRP